MTVYHLSQFLRAGTGFCRIRAARAEAAARSRIYWRRQLALDELPFSLRVYIGLRHCRVQGFRVGMQRGREQLFRRRLFYHLAKVHHSHFVRNILDNGEVMRDEHIRKAEFALEILEEIDYLRLDGDVQRADRLVAHDKFWPRESALAMPILCLLPPSSSCG